MLYPYLKIFHILCAALLLASVVYGCQEWLTSGKIQRFQAQTGSMIFGFIFLQLLSGFTLISLKHADLSMAWIASVTGAFVMMVIGWLSFICFEKHRLVTFCLAGFALLWMIFLMANRS